MRELQLDHLTKCYQDFVAVKDVTLTLGGGVYGLLGANGAGKTTLMRMLCGILEPTKGTVRCGGADIARLGEEYRAMLGYLPQDFGCYPDFTGAEFLRYIAALKGLTRAETDRRTAELLDQVGLGDAGRKKLRAYSGGMRQRLGIAQAMLNDPQILILDEPTAGLDPRERVRFRNLIADYAKGRTVLLSTHIVSDVEAIADEILLMKQGCIEEQGTVPQLAENARGKVWTLHTDAATAARLEAVYTVANLRHEGEGVELRLITADPPAGAQPAPPTLEDVYLWHFADEERTV
ncbi:ATP-binding cassette domain-containing protein [Subdoligranulum variabile]|uniref:ATP-binding cassette domain-containing protein n=1 Tax=Subdoligranulum variabile TaxID=214851 RepID=UPI0026EA2774|nr:ATP-binding cassette domain-containing protein [Subdoligranulum variabile]